MPQKDDRKCLMCEKEFEDARATKKHLKKFGHFVKTETTLKDSYRPHSRERRGCALGARPEYKIVRRRQTRRRRSRRSLGHSSRSRGSSTGPESSSSEHRRSPVSKNGQGRGVDDTREPPQSSNDDGPAAPEQRGHPVLEPPQGHGNDTCAPTAATTQPSGGGSVTSAASSSDLMVGQDLDEFPWEEQKARYREPEEGRSTGM
jgi:hypothetical protein